MLSGSCMTLIYIFIVNGNSVQDNHSRAGKQNSFPHFQCNSPSSVCPEVQGREERGKSDPVLWNTPVILNSPLWNQDDKTSAGFSFVFQHFGSRAC